MLPLSREEIRGRQKQFVVRIQAKKVDFALLFSPTDIFYLTGFHFRPSERPIAFMIDSNLNSALFVPLLEKRHAETSAVIDKVYSYPEYPGIKHPMLYLKEILVGKNIEKKILGCDSTGYRSEKGYRGSLITELLTINAPVSLMGEVEAMRTIKSVAEIKLIKESARWGHLAHELLVHYTKEGAREMAVESRASFEATTAMQDTLGEKVHTYGNGAHAFYRGQIGPHSAFPHAQNQNAQFQLGFNVVSQAIADVWGYTSELERTMFIKELTPTQEMFFTHLINVQNIAFEMIKPGILASRVEEEVQRYYIENNLQQYVLHHAGHSMGLMTHEAPFFDLGDHTILEPGMVFSVEPGLYVEGLGAFRHSDTVVITESAMALITHYPRDLASLIIG